MGLYSGLPHVKDWVTALRPYDWLVTLRDSARTKIPVWKDVQTTQGGDTVHTSNQFMSKFKLMQRLRR